MIKEVKYGQAFSFKYSTRPGTPAAERAQIPESLKTERLHRLQDLIAAQQREIQDQMVGRTVRVLFEKKGRFAGQMVGKSEYLHAVHVTSENVAIGSLESVRITKSKSNSLTGELI